MNDVPILYPRAQRSHLRFWVAGILCFFIFLYLIRSILLPFVVGLLAAYFLDPAVRRLSKQGMSRSAASGVITVSFFLIAGIMCSVLVPLIINQMTALAVEVPHYWQILQSRYGEDVQRYVSSFSASQMEPLKEAASNVGGSLAEMLGKIIPGMLVSSLNLLNILSLIFLTPVVVFYLLRDWDQFVVRVDEMLPRGHADVIRQQLQAIDQTLSGFIRGQTNVCLLMSAYYGIAFSVIGLHFGLGLGILSGFLLFIPFVGYAVSVVICVSLALFQFGWGGQVIAILAVFVVGMMAEGGIITPKLVGGKVGLHPIWIIFGMLAGGTLFGFVGILLSLPVTAVIGVLVRFAISQYLRSSLYKG